MKIKYPLIILLILSTLLNLHANRIDTDNDSVTDEYDKCPNTKDGVFVSNDGCLKELRRIINFESSSSEINEAYINDLKQINEIASEGFGYNIIISGHTDSTADEKFNQNLSKNRAIAVQKFLILSGIDKKRVSIEWFGETKPVATNITKEGRMANRRVEILFK